jgi:hypothetical protein
MEMWCCSVEVSKTSRYSLAFIYAICFLCCVFFAHFAGITSAILAIFLLALSDYYADNQSKRSRSAVSVLSYGVDAVGEGDDSKTTAGL